MHLHKCQLPTLVPLSVVLSMYAALRATLPIMWIVANGANRLADVLVFLDGH